MLRASFLLSTSTTIQALCTPSSQPKSAWVRKCEPVSRRILLARAQATISASCGTSTRNLAMDSSLDLGGAALARRRKRALPEGAADEERAHLLHVLRGLAGAAHGLDAGGQRMELAAEQADHEVVVVAVEPEAGEPNVLDQA